MQTNFETLKEKFVEALNKELSIKKAPSQKASSFTGIAERLKQETLQTGEKIVEILNQVLEQNNVDFDAAEKDKFQEFIAPTINEFRVKFLKG